MCVPAAADAPTGVATRDFSAWVAAEQKRVFLLCLRLLGNAEDADLATQDSFLKAYQAMQKPGAPMLDDPAKWITRIAVNTCLDRLRSRRWRFWQRRPSKLEEWAILSMVPAAGPSPEQALLARQIGERLRAALARLSPQQCSVFVLRHYEDRTLEDIAQVLGLDLGTVKTHMRRALARLRHDLKDLYGK